MIDAEQVVQHLNRMMSGWANYFTLGQVSPAYRAIDMHATKRLRQWFSRKHKLKSRKHVLFPDVRLWDTYGLLQLAKTTRDLPWAKPMSSTESRMRENRTFGLTSSGRKRDL